MTISEPPDQPPNPPGQSSEELLAAVKGLSKGDLQKGVKRADHFTEEDEVSENRKGRTSVSKTLTQVKKWGIWCGFAMVAFMAVLLSWLLLQHVREVVYIESSRVRTLSFLWDTALIVLATLFLQAVFPKGGR